MIMPTKILKGFLIFVFTMKINMMNAQTNPITPADLTAQQRSIVMLSALTTNGNIALLRSELIAALEAGLTVNEIKEVLVHLHAYCGFPRSLNAIHTFMEVLETRKAKGIIDVEGKEASAGANTTDKYEQGRQVLETITGIPQSKPAKGFGEFAPRIDAFLKEHLFGDVFQSDVLTYRQRELATISSLATQPGCESQLQFHISVGMNVGLTKQQLEQSFAILENAVSRPQAEIARRTLAEVLKEIK